MTESIPFNRPYTTGDELGLMADSIARSHMAGDGHYTATASASLRQLTGVNDAMLTTSCTHALEMTALLLDLAPGDEVIMPSFTFVSCANAFAGRGGTPVFVDIRPDTFNLDEALVESAVTDRTKAILAVNYAGVGCEYGVLRDIADRHALVLIEDNAHGLTGKWNGRPLGSFGDLATLSFHETKNVQCGEGGALLLAEDRYVERAEILREKGTNRTRFLRGEIAKYTWVDLGSSYLMSDMLAAFLTAQLYRSAEIRRRHLAVWHRYRSELAPWAAESGFLLPTPPTAADHPGQIFAMLAPDHSSRDRFIGHLRSCRVGSTFHYVPLHSSPGGRRYGRSWELPVTEDVSGRLCRLPVWAGLTEASVDRVISAVAAFS